MDKVADSLREYTDWLSERAIIDEEDSFVLLDIADRIDAEHERRMEQCRRETKKATMRYLNSVIVDYMKHDMKRSRADMLARYERKKKR